MKCIIYFNLFGHILNWLNITTLMVYSEFNTVSWPVITSISFMAPWDFLLSLFFTALYLWGFQSSFSDVTGNKSKLGPNLSQIKKQNLQSIVWDINGDFFILFFMHILVMLKHFSQYMTHWSMSGVQWKIWDLILSTVLWPHATHTSTAKTGVSLWHYSVIPS